VRSAAYRPLYRQFFWLFVAVCLGLGWLGSKPAEGGYVIAARILTFYYFAHFLIVLPLLGLFEKTRPLPTSISESVLGKAKAGAAVLALAVVLGSALAPHPALAQEGHETPQPPREKWSFSGPFGTFDRGQLQRGFKVYREVCSNCHSLKLLSFRNLAEAGGPGFSAAQAATVAGEFKVQDGPNDQGEMFERPGRPADHFPAPFANDAAARVANGGALPPDLSVMAKARTYERGFPWFLIDIGSQFQEQGVDYIVALLNGYEDAPKDFTLPPGAHYNKYFPGHALGMPKPLSDGQVEYTDGTPATAVQYSKDVAAFLMWAAEPHMEARKRVGLQVMIFLIVLAGMLYFTKKRVWSSVAGH
jgi:ubiquinol-cytochrome c reductase cytochrome b/c1 subunit